MSIHVPVQPYDLHKITSLRQKIFEQAFFEYLGMRLQGVGLQQCARAVHRTLNGSNYQAVYDSLMYLAGQILTEQLAKEIAWRLAGNTHRLRAGRRVMPWSCQTEPEWVPVHILTLHVRKNAMNETVGDYVMRILGGSPCPMTIVKTWTPRFCAMLSRRIGFTSRRGELPYYDMAELVNLRARILLQAEHSQNGKPDFKEIGCSGALLEWNKDVIGRRRRLLKGKPWACPNNYSRQCYQCHVGYVDCMAGCHPYTAVMERSTDASISPAPVANT